MIYEFLNENVMDRPRSAPERGSAHAAKKHRKSFCEACGYTQNLHAHHIDRDSFNNQPENIQTLCKECHLFWHRAMVRAGVDKIRMPRLCEDAS